MASQVIHVEVVGRDGAALRRFYSELFGWAFDTNNPSGYGFGDNGDAKVAIGVGTAQDGTTGHVTWYVAVPDIDATLERARALGGRVVTPKFSPGPEAMIALFADPEGHVIGLTQV